MYTCNCCLFVDLIKKNITKKKKNEVIKENMARELWAYENNYNNNNEYEFKWNVRDFFLVWMMKK